MRIYRSVQHLVAEREKASTPLAENWVVKFLSTQVFATLEEFEAFVGEGGLEGLRGPST